jgi:hypothetical protein
VEVAEEFDPALHDASWPSLLTVDGEKLVTVLMPLVHKGASVPVDHRASMPRVMPQDVGHRYVEFGIYRTDLELPPRDARRRRVIVGDAPGQVARNALASKIEVDVGLQGRVEARECTLEVSFGRTEVTARAFSARTKDVRFATIKYN